MRLRNMLKLCLFSWESEPHYAYKRYAYKRKNMYIEISISELGNGKLLQHLGYCLSNVIYLYSPSFLYS